MKVPSWILTFAVTSVSLGPSDQTGAVYDCRFWREPRAEVARAIAETRMGGDPGPGVFYWWSQSGTVVRNHATLAMLKQIKERSSDNK